MSFCRWRGVLGMVCLIALAAPAQTSGNAPAITAPAHNPSPELILPFPSVSGYARAHGIDLGKIGPPFDRPTTAGDLVVLLVTLVDGPVQKQWLLEIEVQEITEKERATKKPPKLILYVSTGNRLVFNYTPVALTMRTHGPFTAKTTDKPIAVKAARSLVNAEHLALGFDRACRTLISIGEHKRKANDPSVFDFSFGGAPFPADVVAKTQAQAKAIGVTMDDERALAGSGPALTSFFEIAQSAPGLREILWEIIDLPSAWSLVKSGGRVQPYFSIDGGKVELTEAPPDRPSRYLFPVNLLLNGQPALNARFVVAAPQPPLLTTAGIVTIYADHPKKPTRRAVIQVMSARLGEPSKANSTVVVQH